MENRNEVFWPLMKNCITVDDRAAMIDFITNADRFTNGPKVKKFEKEWSSWLGCKYSIFVSSGSTANTLLIAAVKEKYNLKDGDRVVVPCMTWVTNVSPVIQLGLEPVFCDVDPHTFSFDVESLRKISKEFSNIKVVFVSHMFGIAADLDAYKEILPDAIFLEDVCESHGTVYKGSKCGTLSEGSTFSFYFGHHMTTIEGGFVCTNDDELYNLMKMKRSHGMAREALPDKYEQYKMFITDGYNLRSMEINAVLGLSQLKHLDKNNKIRKSNLNRFINMINKHTDLFISNYKEEGNSSYCLPFICRTKEIKNEVEAYLSSHGIETRPLCSGNLLRQPFLRRIENIPEPSAFPSVELLHNNGFFIGNNHMIDEQDWVRLENLIDQYRRDK